MLLWLAWPPLPYTGPLLLVAFVPLLSALEHLILSDAPRKGRKVFAICGLTFVVWNTASIYWVYNSLAAVNPAWIAAPISLIPFGLSALLMTCAFWLYYRMRCYFPKIISYLGLVCFWIAYEYLHQTWDLAFPWMTLGNGFAQSHRLVQWYEYTGVYGGTLWIWVANILAFELAMQGEKTAGDLRRKKIKMLALSAWILVPITFSLFIYAGYKERSNPANIVIAQPNIDPYGKWRSISATEQISTLTHLSDSLGQPNTEYFIWPETAIASNIDEDRMSSSMLYMQVRAFLSKYRNGNVLSGAETYRIYNNAATPTAREDKTSGVFFDAYNTAVNIENTDKIQYYHKSKLVPGVEQLPFAQTLSFLKPVFAAFGGSAGGLGFQEKPTVFYAQSGMGVAPVICYESIWGSWVAGYVQKGAQFIAIITNDGWWGNTSGKDQHLDYAKLRAIETRRWVARAANTGISAFINQRGDIVQRTSWWVPAALKQDINLNEELTFYVKHGDYIAYIALCGAMISVLGIGFRKFGKSRQV